jgi:PAS domain S-box-containing protein
MSSSINKPATPWPLIVLFFILSTSAIVGGFFYYRTLEKNLLNETMDQLSTIADLKVRQIIQWRQERISDGIFLSGNIPHIRQFSRFLAEEQNRQLKNDLIRSLKSYTENYDYRSTLFVDRELNVKLFYPGQDTIIGDHLSALLPDVIKKGDVIVTDLHVTGKVSFYHLDLLIPLIGPEETDTNVFGAVIMRIDPDKLLFPLIESWPVGSNTAEALLFHVEGDEIEYLNRQRHLEGGGINMRMPVTDNKLPSSMAVQGINKTTKGIDYRGIAVVAAMKKIPGTPWYLITKIDRGEIYTSLADKIGQIVIIIILVIITSGLLLVFLWWNQRVRFYKGKYEAELERLALVKHFDYILKYANDIILLFDKDYRIVSANDRAIDTYQYNRSDLIGKNISELRSADTISSLEEDLVEFEKIGYSTFETIHRKKDGSTFPIEISARKVEIEGVKYYQSISRDISERKKAEEILRESEERFRKIFEESPFSMVMAGKDMGIIKANLSFCKMMGYTEEELLGLTFKNFTHPEHIAPDELSILRLVAQEIPIYHTEKRYLRKDGSIIWGSTTVNIIRNSEGEAQLFFAMIEDITNRKKAETELMAAKEKAEESDRLKTAFLHNVSHEIRTPMNAILGFSSLLNEQGIKEDERKQFVEIISQSSILLLSIINDIVDLASIESGQVRLNIQKINLNDELRKLSEQFSYKQKAHGISLIVETPLTDRNANIFTDSTKLIQILSNLINNAYKFTKKGKISFGYNLRDDFLEFFVKDTGVGIPPEHQDRVFDRFYQVDSAVSRQYSGTGLGLSICKAYAELLGGRIWLTSVPNEGSIFSFTIPYKKKEG